MPSANVDVVLENQISKGKAEVFHCVGSFVNDAFAARRADMSAKELRNIVVLVWRSQLLI